MFEVGGAIDEDSAGALGGPGFGLDWLKRRMSEALRAGRASTVLLAKGEGACCVEVEGCCDGAAM